MDKPSIDARIDLTGVATWALIGPQRIRLEHSTVASHGAAQALDVSGSAVEGSASIHEGVSRLRPTGGQTRSGYSVLIGIAHRLRAIARAGLVEDAVDVGLHGRVADDKSLGDLGIRQSARDQLEYLCLPGR